MRHYLLIPATPLKGTFWVIALAAVLLHCVPANADHSLNLQAKDLNGAKQNLSMLRGKIVVLNFWATWCGPCQEEMPRLSGLAQKYSGKDVEFIAVSVDGAKDRPKIQPFLESHRIAMKVWVGPDAAQLDDFGLGNIVPGTIILNQRGQALFRIMGEASEEDVEAPLDWLIGGSQGPAPKALVKRY
jgi:thiol-disulfide isomerase/thioredoxin